MALKKLLDKLCVFLKNNYIVVTIFILTSISIILNAYFFNSYISPDSGDYLLEAKALLSGHGLNATGLAGVTNYFAIWPIGYPLLISLTSIVTRITDLYLVSKISSLIVLLVIVLLLIKYFKKDAWIYSLIFFTTGFSLIFYYAWSEGLLILSLLAFSFCLYEIIIAEHAMNKNYLLLFFLVVLCFLTKYVGACTLLISGLVFLYYLIRYIKKKRKIDFLKVKKLFIVCFFSLVFIVAYLYMNYKLTGHLTGMERLPAPETLKELLSMLHSGLVTEVTNVFFFLKIDNVRLLDLILLLLIIFIINYFVKKRNKISQNYIMNLSLLLTATIYFIAIVFLRFTSHFDNLSYRFLFPTTFLLMIIIINILIEYLKSLEISFKMKIPSKVHLIILSSIIILCLLSFYKNYNESDLVHNSYNNIKKEYLTTYEEVKPNSLVIWGDHPLMYLRPDIFVTTPGFDPYYKKEKLDTFLDRISQFPGTIYIDVYNLKIVLNQSYDETIINYFEHLRNNNNRFVILK